MRARRRSGQDARVRRAVQGDRRGNGDVLGGVQKSVRRARKFADALATGSPGDVVAVVDDELTCGDVQTPEDVQRLNKLEI